VCRIYLLRLAPPTTSFELQWIKDLILQQTSLVALFVESNLLVLKTGIKPRGNLLINPPMANLTKTALEICYSGMKVDESGNRVRPANMSAINGSLIDQC
jgi:hypothetical protein